MKRLLVEIERTEERIRAAATVACDLVDSNAFREITPEQFGDLQHELRSSLLRVERRLHECRDRIKRRTERLNRRCGNKPGFGRFLGDLRSALVAREDALAWERRTLRQFGDLLAWLALDAEPNVIGPLFAPATHGLPAGLGLGGVVAIAKEAHKSGRFLALENDLTRCLGIGDLTVVPFRKKWSQPLSFEIKTKRQVGVDEMATVNVHAISSEGSLADLVAEFREATGMNTGPDDNNLDRSHPDQARRLMSRGKYLHQLSRIEFQRVAPPDSERWKPLRASLDRGVREGFAVEVVEEGLAYIVQVRNRQTSVDLRQVKEDLRAKGFDDDAEQASSIDFQMDDHVAGLISPIAMWKIAKEHRIGLLTGEVELTTVVAAGAWERAFERLGLTVEMTRQGWIVRGGKRDGIIPAPIAERIRLGAFFEGLSIRQMAESIRASIDAE